MIPIWVYGSGDMDVFHFLALLDNVFNFRQIVEDDIFNQALAVRIPGIKTIGKDDMGHRPVFLQHAGMANH